MNAANNPCVYGTEISANCPVQAVILQPNIRSYERLNDPAAQQARLIGEALASANNNAVLMLAAFCQACPALHAYKLRESKK